MKNLILLATVILSSNVFANNEFRPCNNSDLRTLEVAHSRYSSLKDIVRSELLANSESCMVSKPRIIQPAVCGINVPVIDTYKFMTDRSARFEVVVDSSYVACQRTRALIIPTIRSLKFVDLPILPHTREM